MFSARVDVWVVSKEVQLEVLFESMQWSCQVRCTADMEEETWFLMACRGACLDRRYEWYRSVSTSRDGRDLATERTSMEYRDAMVMDELAMFSSGVSFVLCKLIGDVMMVLLTHPSISLHLGNDTGHRD